jgi:protease I
LKLKGKCIAIFLENQYEDKEFWIPWYRMKEEGAKVVSIGPKTAAYSGKRGIPATTEKAIDEVSSTDFDALIIPGGYAPDLMRRHPAMIEFVREMDRAGKVVAAICHAGWMLVSADILRDRNATSFHSIRDDMVNAGARWVDEEVVRDRNLITSRTPDDLPAFCRMIIASLAS